MKYYFLALGTLVVVCVGCTGVGGSQHAFENRQYSAPPASMMARPGPMVDGPGPGVLPMYAHPSPPRAFATRTTQIRFVGPDGMQVGWQITGGYAVNQLSAPGGRYNFRQNSTYRLKLTDIQGRPGLTLYPTLEVYPSHPTTDAYLSHANVPIELNDEDLDQIETNNFVTKVIYLPERKFAELAIAGVDTLVSTRLEPGIDPVAEADRRGTIMVVLRLGNMDMEMPGGGMKGAAFPGGINQVSYRTLDGDKNQHMPPMPIAGSKPGMLGVPTPMVMGRPPRGPGQAAIGPVSGVGGAPQWGKVMTSTPIGLPGPPHLPYGGPASLKSHTVRNFTKTDLGKPVDHFVLDVKHKPGLRIPHPAKHVEYTETHPSYKAGEVSYPDWATPGR